MADWLKLPCDLLPEIVMRLATIEDFFYFSAVCRLWNEFASMVKHEFYVKTTPWLLLAENTKDNPDCIRKVYNPYNNKCYHMKLPEIAGCRCWGSAYGWIVTYRDSELHLFNPLTKARLSLPSRSCLPYRSAEVEHIIEEGTVEDGPCLCFFNKAFVFEVAPHDVVVLVTYFVDGYKLAFARPGDDIWTSIEPPPRMGKYYNSNIVRDIVVHGAKILILYRDVSIGYLDISDFNDPQKLTLTPIDPRYWSDPEGLCLKAREYVPPYPSMLSGLNWPMEGLYLVDSSSKNLLLVTRNRYDYGNDDEYDYATTGFSVYRLGFDSERWSQVHDLGDVLFVGNNSTMPVPAFRAGNCESKSIYFTDDASHYWNLPTNGGKDVGVFKLEGGQLDEIYVGSDNKSSKKQTPLWFMPRF